MADNNNDDLRQWMEGQEQTSKAQQEALANLTNASSAPDQSE